MISHATDKVFKDQNGQEYNQIVPTLDAKPRNIVSRMSDIIGYSRCVEGGEDDGTPYKSVLFMRGTPRFVAGSRFKYTPDYIDFNYQSLVNAICDAIDKQALEDGAQYFTDDNSNLYNATVKTLDFDELMLQFNDIVTELSTKSEGDTFTSYWQPRITQVIETYLGKGMRVSNCTRDQVEALDLIVTELKDFLN